MDVHRTVAEFFHDAVHGALEARRIEASAATEFYLVNLLVEFMDARRIDPEPLGLKLATLPATSGERIHGLKEIGDTSLYLTGFFADSLARKMVGPSYYISVGGAAYRQLATLLRGTSLSRDVYRELAACFARFVDVFHDVRDRTAFAGGHDIVRLYEEWVRTGNEALERQLRASGMLLDASGKREKD
jgi:hypothetical protein